MAKVSAKDRKEKKEIAQRIMEFYGIKYNDWLHEQHFNYINENLAQYMEDQQKQFASDNQKSDPETSSNESNLGGTPSEQQGDKPKF